MKNIDITCYVSLINKFSLYNPIARLMFPLNRNLGAIQVLCSTIGPLSRPPPPPVSYKIIFWLPGTLLHNT